MREGFETKLNDYELEEIRQVDKRICHFYFLDLKRYYEIKDSKTESDIAELSEIMKNLNKMRFHGYVGFNWKTTHKIFVILTNHNQKTTERKIIEWLNDNILNTKKDKT